MNHFFQSKFSFTNIYVHLASAKKAFISEELKINPFFLLLINLENLDSDNLYFSNSHHYITKWEITEYYVLCMCALSHFSLLTLWEPMRCRSPPGSSVHGVLQARVLEWVAMPSSRRSFRPWDRTHISCLLHWRAGSLTLVPPGKPLWAWHLGGPSGMPG